MSIKQRLQKFAAYDMPPNYTMQMDISNQTENNQLADGTKITFTDKSTVDNLSVQQQQTQQYIITLTLPQQSSANMHRAFKTILQRIVTKSGLSTAGNINIVSCDSNGNAQGIIPSTLSIDEMTQLCAGCTNINIVKK